MSTFNRRKNHVFHLPEATKSATFRQKIKRLHQNMQCRTLQALAIIRTHHNQSISLPKIRRPQVICQSRTHSSAIISRSCFFIVFDAIFTKSRSPVTSASPPLANQPRIGKNRTRNSIAAAILSESIELKPGNRRFLPKSSTFTKNTRRMSPALTNRLKIGKDKIARMKKR